MVLVSPSVAMALKLTVIQSFWISYQDLLKRFKSIDRTQLFGSDWSVTQRWTSAEVPWSVQYLDTSFQVSISKAARVVIVLCQVGSSGAGTLLG